MMRVMIVIFEILLCSMSIALLVVLGWAFFDLDEKIPLFRYFSEMSHPSYKHYARLDFEKFKTFYRANPEAWWLDDFKVGRWDKNSLQRIYFCFNYSDWRKYCKFQKQLEKEEDERHERWLEKERDKDLLRLTELVQQDIDRLNKKAEEERKSAEKVVVRVAENLTDKGSKPLIREDGVLVKAAKAGATHTIYKTYDEILEAIHDNISKWEQL